MFMFQYQEHKCDDITVSYTQLDVYKRQPLSFAVVASRKRLVTSSVLPGISTVVSALFFFFFSRFCEKVTPGHTMQARNITPVSYTHLDVYKRQVHSAPSPANVSAAALMIFAVQTPVFLPQAPVVFH